MRFRAELQHAHWQVSRPSDILQNMSVMVNVSNTALHSVEFALKSFAQVWWVQGMALKR